VEEVGVSLCVAYWFCCGRKLTSTLGPERRLTKGARGNIERKLNIEDGIAHRECHIYIREKRELSHVGTR
jgi:hypothetical protein